MLLGWPHVVFNQETERHDFLYDRKQNAEIFKECWNAYTEGKVVKHTEDKAGPVQQGENIQKAESKGGQVEKDSKRAKAETPLPKSPCTKGPTKAQ